MKKQKPSRRLRICVGSGDRRWWEDYDAGKCVWHTSNVRRGGLPRVEEIKTEEDGERWGRRLIEWFNETLRPGERPRRFLWSELVEEIT